MEDLLFSELLNLQVRVRDRKGSPLHSVDEELGSWRFALAKLFTLSEMRVPTQVNTSLPIFIAKYN